MEPNRGFEDSAPATQDVFTFAGLSNPEHLVWHASRSAAERGRAKAAGEKNGRAKLTEAEARRLLEVY